MYHYLTENKILYPKQFGFQKGHSIEHAIVQLVDQIFESFQYNKYTLFFSTYLKPLIQSNIQYFLKKMELYGLKTIYQIENNLSK